MIKISMQYFAEDEKSEEEKSTEEQNTEQNQNQGQNQNSSSNNVDNNAEDEEEKKPDFSAIFGMSEKDIRKLIDDKKARDDANKDAETKLAEALEEKNRAEAKVSAMMMGAKPDCVDDVITLATAKSNDGKQFKAVISEIKKKHPDMFTNGNEEPGKKGTGSSIGNNQKSGNKGESLGARLGKAKAKTTKSSFFGK